MRKIWTLPQDSLNILTFLDDLKKSEWNNGNPIIAPADFAKSIYIM